MCQNHDSDRLATPIRRPVLTRMPKIACLATAVRFTRTLPTVSAHVPVSRSTQTPPDCDYQVTTPFPVAKPALAASDSPLCLHRCSHAFVQGHWIPVCLRCGDPEKSEGQLAVASPSDNNASVSTTIAVGARPVLYTMQGFPFDLRRSGVEASRLMGWSVEREDLDRCQDKLR